MLFNSATATLALLGFAASAQAHTVFHKFFVDNKDQGEGTCVRMDQKGATINSPIGDITGPDMACGRTGELGVARVCDVNAGAKLTFEFRHNPSRGDPAVIGESHKGTCTVYMKKVESAGGSNNAAGDGWFKIYEDVEVNEATDEWCTIRLIKNNGLLPVTLPADIEAGDYLVRPEILALHAAATAKDPQFFLGCAQIRIAGGGSAKPETIAIPQGYVTMKTPAVTFNVYKKPLLLPFPSPGPPVYGSSGVSAAPQKPVASEPKTLASGAADLPPMTKSQGSDASYEDYSDPECDAAGTGSDDEMSAPAASGGKKSASESSDDVKLPPTIAGDMPTPASSGDEMSAPAASGSKVPAPATSGRKMPANMTSSGQKPAGCILEIANWCGFEVPTYTDAKSCWDASSDCWDQSQKCWDSNTPASWEGCKIWQKKCDAIVKTCQDDVYPGPPNAGKVLTAERPDLPVARARARMALVKKHETHALRHARRACGAKTPETLY